jgi:hypothetical protein
MAEHGIANGAESLPELEAERIAPAGQTEVDKAHALIDERIRAPLGVMIRGLLVSLSGIPPHEILNSIARVTGKMEAEAIMADMATHFSMRKGFKEAFAKGISQAPMNMPK